MKGNKREYLRSFRFTAEVGEFLEAEAERQNRSVNNLVETIAKEAMAKHQGYSLA